MATSNTFSSMEPDLKQSYSDKKKRFSRIKKRVAQKAMSELEASKNPMGWMETHKNESIKNRKGVAF